MLSEYGTEQVGISVEVALADLYGVEIDFAYRSRSRSELVSHIAPALSPLLGDMPNVVKHIAGDQNPIDFLLENDETLSVKSNMREAGKIAPQNIGQPTSSTFWSKLPHLIPAGTDPTKLAYAESAKLFKQVAQTKIETLLTAYWENLFDCDYLIYVSNVLDKNDNLTPSPTVRLYKKAESPAWDSSRITFTRSLADWNESCTVKYGGESIGEFQIHNNRNCFKFRFNLSGLMASKLL